MFKAMNQTVVVPQNGNYFFVDSVTSVFKLGKSFLFAAGKKLANY
jgi:hypothetical protein